MIIFCEEKHNAIPKVMVVAVSITLTGLTLVAGC